MAGESYPKRYHPLFAVAFSAHLLNSFVLNAHCLYNPLWISIFRTNNKANNDLKIAMLFGLSTRWL